MPKCIFLVLVLYTNVPPLEELYFYSGDSIKLNHLEERSDFNVQSFELFRVSRNSILGRRSMKGILKLSHAWKNRPNILPVIINFRSPITLLSALFSATSHINLSMINWSNRIEFVRSLNLIQVQYRFIDLRKERRKIFIAFKKVLA